MFQQDGTLAHYDRVVQEWLNDKFGEKWIGCCGFVEWPPRSPNVSQCVFVRSCLQEEPEKHQRTEKCNHNRDFGNQHQSLSNSMLLSD